VFFDSAHFYICLSEVLINVKYKLKLKQVNFLGLCVFNVMPALLEKKDETDWLGWLMRQMTEAGECLISDNDELSRQNYET